MQINQDDKMSDKDYQQEALFIDEHRNILKGEDALEKIREKQEEVVEGKGILEVDRKRWEEAQRYEKRTWMDGRAALSDRNEDHCEKFGNFWTLRGRSFARVIELGSGPFTNLRLILEHIEADEIHLLDPLMKEYLKHPYCRYRGGKYGGVLTSSVIPFSFKGGLKDPRKFLKYKINEWKVGGFFGRKIQMNPCGIEDFEVQDKYDLVVMINVIEHCRDVGKIFSQIKAMLKPGGTFVWSDKMHEAEVELEKVKRHYDAGHPIRVDYSVINDFLAENFDEEFQSVVTKYMATEDSDDAQRHRWQYYIGRFRG